MSERTRYCSRCLTTFATDAERCPNLGCRAGRAAGGWGELLDGGEVIDRTYRIHERLAIGGAGVTYLAGELAQAGGDEVGPRVAIKVLYQQRDQGTFLRRLSTEAQILQALNHPNIVECRGFVHRAGHSPYLVTRYEEGGSLLDHIRRVGTLPIHVVAGIGRQICWALDVAHRQGVVHRDLKPENVLLVRAVALEVVPEVRVADFGIAKVYGSMGDRLTRVGAFVGTPQYAAPEQFEGLAPEPATDVYALGALLYFCLTARPIADFMAELEPDSQREHLVRHLPPKLGAGIGPEDQRRWMQDTLALAMAVDPGDRSEITLLEARFAAIQSSRDPGFVPVSADSTLGSSATISGLPELYSVDTLDTSNIQPLTTADVREARRGPVPVAPLAVPTLEAQRTPAPSPPAPLTNPVPNPVPTLDPSARPTLDAGRAAGPTRAGRPRPPASSSSAAPLGCGLVALAGTGAATILAALVGYFWWVQPLDLTGKETDPAARADWVAVATALGQRAPAAVTACTGPPGLALGVVVSGAGAIESVYLVNWDHEPARRCIEAALQKEPFPRKGTGRVRVAVTLPR